LLNFENVLTNCESSFRSGHVPRVVETLFCRNNTSLGPHRLWYTWRTSTSTVPGSPKEREEARSKHCYQHGWTTCAILENETSSHSPKLLSCSSVGVLVIWMVLQCLVQTLIFVF